jgi:hypothetical protein
MTSRRRQKTISPSASRRHRRVRVLFFPVSGRRRRTIWMAWAAWGEASPAGDGGDFQGSPFRGPVAFVPGLMGDGDVPPGQGGELGVQAGLIALTVIR